jgi:hypothetical protein
MDAKTVQRAVRKLAKAGIIYYQAGNGRGRLSVVGVPPAAAKGGHRDVPSPAAKGGHSDVPLSSEKGGHGDAEKVDTHAYARADAILTRASEKKAVPEERAAASSAPAGEDDDFETALGGIRLRGPRRQIVLDAYRENAERVRGLIADALARTGVRNRGGLLVRMVEDGDEPDTTRGLTAREIMDMNLDGISGALRQPDRPGGLNAADLTEHIMLLEELERRQQEQDDEVGGEVVAEEWADDVVPEEPAVAEPEPTMIVKSDESTADAVIGLSRAVNVAESPWLQESVARLADAARRRGEREDSELGHRDAA